MNGGAKPIFDNQRRRVLEKKRIQTLKSWHDNVKKIAKSEMDFIASILQDDAKDTENRDWIRDDKEDENTVTDGKMVKADS